MYISEFKFRTSFFHNGSIDNEVNTGSGSSPHKSVPVPMIPFIHAYMRQ